MATGKERLAFAAHTVNSSAFRTGLRRVGGIDTDKRPATFFQFIGENGFKPTPALIANASVQSRLLPNIAPRRGKSALGRSCHVLDIEIFENHGSESFGNIQRYLVLPITADTCNACRQLRNSSRSFNPTLRSTFFPRYDFLNTAPFSFQDINRSWDREHFARGKCQCIGNTAIYSDTRTDIGRRDMLNFTDKGCMPTVGIERNAYVFDLAAHGTCIAELHPTDLGEPYGRPLTIHLLDLDLATKKTKGIIDAFFARRWISGPTRKEIFERLIQVPQRLLFTSLANSSDPIEFGAQGRKFTSLRKIIKLLLMDTLVSAPMISTLLQSKIVNESAHARELQEQRILFLRRNELISKTAINHVQPTSSEKVNMGENLRFIKGSTPPPSIRSSDTGRAEP
ncbi:MAG: hypothetical protein BGP09_31175 [Rhizobium sp. 60-20]|nr:MAG: hypothetical protein BGP09_31175 [Rhizobium sp. 60-20]